MGAKAEATCATGDMPRSVGASPAFSVILWWVLFGIAVAVSCVQGLDLWLFGSTTFGAELFYMLQHAFVSAALFLYAAGILWRRTPVRVWLVRLGLASIPLLISALVL